MTEVRFYIGRADRRAQSAQGKLNIGITRQWADCRACYGGFLSPETDDVAKAENIIAQVKKRHIEYPVAFDRDGDSWKAFGNRYWPAVYLIDRQGKVRFRWEGELESGDAHGDSIMRQRIEALLAEKE